MLFYKELILILSLSFIFGRIEAYDCLGYPWYDATILGPHSMGCIRFYGTQRMTWIEAEDFCRSQNAHLIEIYDDVQQQFVRDIAYDILQDFSMGYHRGDWWIGLTKYSDGDWYWSDSRQKAEYTVWESGRPINGSFAYLGFLPQPPGGYFDWIDCSNECGDGLFPVCQMPGLTEFNEITDEKLLVE